MPFTSTAAGSDATFDWRESTRPSRLPSPPFGAASSIVAAMPSPSSAVGVGAAVAGAAGAVVVDGFVVSVVGATVVGAVVGVVVSGGVVSGGVVVPRASGVVDDGSVAVSLGVETVESSGAVSAVATTNGIAITAKTTTISAEEPTARPSRCAPSRARRGP